MHGKASLLGVEDARPKGGPNFDDDSALACGTCQPFVAHGRFVLSKNFRRNNGLGSMLDLAAQMG